MGQQQLLILIVCIMIVGIAIAVSIGLFNAHHGQANKDEITASLAVIANDAYQYKIRPTILGGGRPSYIGYSIPTKFRSDDNGRYEITGTVQADQIQILGTSSIDDSWTATCTVDSIGNTRFSYSTWD